MIPLSRQLQRAYEVAYNQAREEWRSCVEASRAGITAARALYVARTGLDDALTDACVAAMIWPGHPYGTFDRSNTDRGHRRPDDGEQGDETADGLSAWAIRFFAGEPRRGGTKGSPVVASPCGSADPR